ncbi:DUF4123 domain-containing protein [Vibrio zhugei]|nr:DUF4123 domain-containing protein [Vibrio zhugei]
MSSAPINPEWRIYPFDLDSLYHSPALYMIVETLLWEDWKFNLYKHGVEPEFAPLFHTTPYQHIDEGPVVMRITRSKELIDMCVEHMNASPCGCFITTSDDIEWKTLLSTLRQAIMAPNERTEVLLRYYDPRTLLPLLAVMSDEERTQLFPGIQQFIWTSQQQWLVSTMDAAQQKDESQPWILTDAKLEHMQTVLDQWS